MRPKGAMHNERTYDGSVSITECKEFEGSAALPRCAPGWEEVGLRDRLVRAPRRAHGTRACGEGSSSWGWRPTSRGGLASDVSDDHRKNEAGEVVDLGRIVDPFEGLRRRSRLPPESGKLTAKTILPSL